MRTSWQITGALSLLVAGVASMMSMSAHQNPPKTKAWVIAHRGASAYAPENTVPAFRLAAEQGADWVEFDLQLTKDRKIVALHDNSLERTTDVEQVFPDRARKAGEGAQATSRWMLDDFTLEEIKRLDAGTWFDAKFRGTRIPTFGETIDSLRGRAGLFIELKTPERYEGIERMILDELKAKGLARPGADPKTPVLLQSFTVSSLEILTQKFGTKLPVHFLVGARDVGSWMTPEGLKKVKAFATGISPEKAIVSKEPDVVSRAKAMGMPVTPYTFRASAVTGYPDVRAEMAQFIDRFGVDGVITDNPDKAPGR
jgi:glycerophosphoryl diester phosphodiesterase